MTGYTASGLPFPSPEDSANTVADQVRALAEAIDTAVSGPWQDWTPVWTNIATPGIVRARFKAVGKSIHFRLLASNTGQTGSGQIQFTVPVPPLFAGMQYSFPFRFYTGGTDQYLGFGVLATAFGTNRMGLYLTGTGAVYTAASFFSGSNFDIGGTYEAA